MAKDIDDRDRTNAVGLFNTARSWWRSAEHLNAAALKVTHPQAPVIFLFCHAIELYLKAYLRGVETSLAQLKKVGHRVADLAKAASESGLDLRPEDFEVLAHIDETDMAIESRYIVTGFKTLATSEALSPVAETLDRAVCAALSKSGFAVRKEIFQRFIPQRQDEVEKVEEYIPYMTQKDKEIIGYLLHHNLRMFECEPDGGHARLLLSRGIVQIAAKDGQHVDYSNVPFEIPLHVWDVLVKHKDKFPYVSDDDGADPWRVSWMER